MKTFKNYFKQFYIESADAEVYRKLRIWYRPLSAMGSIKILSGEISKKLYYSYTCIDDGVIAKQSSDRKELIILISKSSIYFNDIIVGHVVYDKLPAKLQILIKQALDNKLDDLNLEYNRKKTLSHDDEMPDVGDIFD